MSFLMASTKAKVKDVEKLNEVRSNYELQGIDFQVDDAGRLTAVGLEDDDWHWPQALKDDQLPYDKLDPEKDEDAWDEALSDLYEEKGDDGFLSLLGEVAACLESPLVILAVRRDEGFLVGATWIVQPGV
jgi:hypothetical protein